MLLTIVLIFAILWISIGIFYVIKSIYVLERIYNINMTTKCIFIIIGWTLGTLINWPWYQNEAYYFLKEFTKPFLTKINR